MPPRIMTKSNLTFRCVFHFVLAFFSLATSLDIFAQSIPDSLYPQPLNIFKTEGLEATPLSQSQAEAWFSFFEKRNDISFNYPDDGCYARAHKMAYLMDQAGIRTLKIFISFDPKTQFATSLNPNGYVKWGWHVAPALLIDNNGSKSIWILDPSVYNKLLPRSQWQNLITSHGIQYTSRVVPQYVYRWESPTVYSWIPNEITDMEKENLKFISAGLKRGFNPLRKSMVEEINILEKLYVESIRDNLENIEIRFSGRAGIYTLNKGQKNFSKLKLRIENALKDKKIVTAKINLFNLTIDSVDFVELFEEI